MPGGFVFWLVPAALASPSYPTDLEAELGMPCLPPCTVCHDSNLGGAGTVTEAFGLAMMEAGLQGGSQADLLARTVGALDADSDGDGATDVDELTAGDDPNQPGPDGGPALCGGDVVEPPQYGCFDQAQAGAGLTAAFLSVAMARRRR